MFITLTKYNFYLILSVIFCILWKNKSISYTYIINWIDDRIFIYIMLNDKKKIKKKGRNGIKIEIFMGFHIWNMSVKLGSS